MIESVIFDDIAQGLTQTEMIDSIRWYKDELKAQKKEAEKSGKKFEHAIKIYKRILTIKPEDSNVYFNLGLLWTELGKIDKAIECYLISKRLNSKNFLTY